MSGRLFVFTGAGLSAESGISTFRDANGLWENHSIMDVCHIMTWDINKSLVFDFYNARRQQLREVSPNAAHATRAELERELGEGRFFHVTMNVDDLAEAAGMENVVHVHGKLKEMRCLSCKHVWDVGYDAVPVDTACPICGKNDRVKPNVVFFGESAPLYEKMWQIFYMPRVGDIILIIGTSGVVVSLNWMVDGMNRNVHSILVNKHDSNSIDEDLFDEVIKEEAGVALPRTKQKILEYLKKE